MSERLTSSPIGNIDNRLSELQREILDALSIVGQPTDNGDGSFSFGHLPTTGTIIEVLERPASRSSYAAVSRALRRLEERNLVQSYTGFIYRPGKGRRYCLAA